VRTGRGERRLRGARGAAAVEFAIVLPVLMLLVFGVLEWGWYFFLETTVVNSAREAARAASVAPTDLINSSATDAMNTALTAGSLDPSKATSSVTVTVDSVVVTVSYPAGTLTGVTFIPLPSVAFGRAEMRR
jgi:Flp pilus assembly protein TadG